MEQLTFHLHDEKPSHPIPQDLQSELIALMAQAIIEMLKNPEEKTNDNL